MLGVGTHEVWVMDRDGHRIARLTEVLQIQWSRIRDDVSQARVIVEQPSQTCCDVLADLRTVRNELVITRNGEQVWDGVITYLAYDENQVEIGARDLTWLLRRVGLSRKYDYTSTRATEATKALETMIGDHAAQIGRGFTVVRLASPGEARTAGEHEQWAVTLGALLDSYADNRGIDYAQVGRNLVLWDTNFAHTTLPMLDDSYLSNSLGVREYGSELATRTIRRAQTTVTITTAPKTWTDYYGLVDQVINDIDEDDDTSTAGQDIIVKQEQGRLEASTPAPQRVLMPANTTLAPETPVDIQQLVPGAWAPLQSTRTCREVRSWGKLDSLQVTEGPEGESVNVSFGSAPVTMVRP